jgi:hypothetical protein
MTYSINGTTLALQPTQGKWLDRGILGIDGNGHPVYPAVYQFQLTWGIASTEEFYEVLGLFDAISITGSAVASLPKLRSSTYTFYDYSGCVLHEPTLGEYFAEYPTKVELLITNIRA